MYPQRYENAYLEFKTIEQDRERNWGGGTSGDLRHVPTSLAYSRNCLIKGTHFTSLQTSKKEVSLKQRLVCV